MLVLAALVAVPGTASAACGAPPTLITAVEEAHTVFIGRTVEVTNRGRTAQMEVLQIWKGRDLPQFVTVAGGPASVNEISSDDRVFEAGRTYLVFPHNRTSPFTDDRCTATRFYDPPPGGQIPSNLSGAAGATVARVPDAAASADSGGVDGARMMPWIIGMGLLLLILLVVWSYGRFTKSNTDRASALRQQRIDAERQTLAAAAAAEEERPKPITHAASPFRKSGLARIPGVRSIVGRFRRSGLRSARKMTSQMQKKYK